MPAGNVNSRWWIGPHGLSRSDSEAVEGSAPGRHGHHGRAGPSPDGQISHLDLKVLGDFFGGVFQNDASCRA